MVKSLSAILISFALLLSAALFEWFYVEKQFSSYGEELEALYEKTEAENAKAEDAVSVQKSWEARKKKLHVWIPHNDITRMDEYMAETVRLIGEREYSLALAKIEVLLHLTECLPGTYRPAVENIL